MMTLVIALACRDGIVMASDGQATASSSAGPVKLQYIKIRQIGNSTLWAGAGDIEFTQKVEKEIDNIPKELREAGIDKIRYQHLLAKVFGIRKSKLDRFRGLYGERGESRATPDVLLIADYTGEAPRIIHVSPNVDDTELQEFGFGAIGIGDTFAHTILKSYDVRELSVEEGKALAYKVIRDAIEVGAFGLGEPIDIWTITKVKVESGGLTKAQRLREEEMIALRDVYNALKEAEVETFKRIIKKAAEEKK